MQSVLFLTLLGAQLGVVTGLRTRLLTRANPFPPITVLASAALGLAGVYGPMLRDLLGTHALPAGSLLIPLAGAILGFAAARVDRRIAARGRTVGDR
ncbi:cation transporting ATPase C-terminal domain-containing protein [Embleya sp. NBC_00896]|uniref:cation transporting ATPase C-terminal domain-containing protein n=1 Tax=Embleya sp. NBC_00896 TaxID=2975961 RepID=UPI002F9091D3|nr:cation-translocating P-type ATPase C-terminal domain-containing protein [Embleya sp. NBC_00896]